MKKKGDTNLTILEMKTRMIQRREGEERRGEGEGEGERGEGGGENMKPNSSKAKLKSLNLHNRSNTTTKLGKKQKNETNMYTEMHNKLKNGSQASQT